jgi:rod shape-determining protein MreC
MFSRNLLIFAGVALFIAINFTVITMSSRESLPSSGIEKITIFFVFPIRNGVTKIIRSTRNIWDTYFMAVLAVQENIELKNQLGKAIEIQNYMGKFLW